MVFDDVANFGYGVIQTPPSPATTGQTFTLTAGQGNNFLTPVNGYNLLIWPGPSTIPTKQNAEIVRLGLGGKSGDTFTVTRQQESTLARSIVQGDYVMHIPSGKMFTDLINAILTLNTDFIGLPSFPGGTAQGYLPFYSALNVLSALGPGTAGQFLQTQGAGQPPIWATVNQGSMMGGQTSVTGSTTANSMQPATGTVAITTTRTANIFIMASLQVYSNPAGAWGESILAQLTNGGVGFGPTMQQFLTTGNPRFQVPIAAVLLNQPAATYTFGVQFRSANTNLVTIENGYINAIAI